jgi:hypothetical protein
MRPLMAQFLEPTIEAEARGSYDETLAVTLDLAGRPIVELAGVETFTKVASEPTDDGRAWLALETLTFTTKEPTDDEPVPAPAQAAETFTRVADEPTDDDSHWAEAIRTGLPPADDAATGLVSF